MGAAGNKKPKGMHKKHAPAYQVEETMHENDLKKRKEEIGKSLFLKCIEDEPQINRDRGSRQDLTEINVSLRFFNKKRRAYDTE